MERDVSCVLDASVLINLLATGDAGGILRRLPFRCMVEAHSFREVRREPEPQDNGRQSLEALVESRDLDYVHLESADEYESFLSLVGAEPPDELGQGEAGAMAIAASRSCVVGTDDKKAQRIIESKGRLMYRTSVDLLRIASAYDDVGVGLLFDWVDKALRVGRMRVPFKDLPWVIAVVGSPDGKNYPSLKYREGTYDSMSELLVSPSFVPMRAKPRAGRPPTDEARPMQEEGATESAV